MEERRGPGPAARAKRRRSRGGGVAATAAMLALLSDRLAAAASSPRAASAARSLRRPRGGGGDRRTAAALFAVGGGGSTAKRDDRTCGGVAAGGWLRPPSSANRPSSYCFGAPSSLWTASTSPPLIPMGGSAQPLTEEGSVRGLHARAAENSDSVTNTNVTAKAVGDTVDDEKHAALNVNEIEPNWENAFTLDLPEGRCVGVRLADDSCPASSDEFEQFAFDSVSDPDHWVRRCLHPYEIDRGLTLSCDAARGSFFLGRMAIRMALLSVEKEKEEGGQRRYTHAFLPPVGESDHAIVRDEHGRPALPSGYLGSISHKTNTGVALVCPSDRDRGGKEAETPTRGIGVDIEWTRSRHRSVARRVLTKAELAELGKVEGVTTDEEVLLRFSLKESVYKAMHPLINQYVGFQEAEIAPRSDGTADVRLFLKNGAHERLGTITAHWRRVMMDGTACASYGRDGEKGERIGERTEGEAPDTEAFFLSSASVCLRDDDREI